LLFREDAFPEQFARRRACGRARATTRKSLNLRARIRDIRDGYFFRAFH
jgi:hypothetical protein